MTKKTSPGLQYQCNITTSRQESENEEKYQLGDY